MAHNCKYPAKRNLTDMNRLLLAIAVVLLPLKLRAMNTGDSSSSKPEEIRTIYAEHKKAFADFQKKHGHFIQTPNVNMHYVTYGKPSGIPVIWCHGTYGTAFDIYTAADSMVKHGYYVVAIEYYGHGMTPAPDKEVTLWHVADDIRFLMDKMKIKKAVIGGFSRGGSIATAFYNLYPDRVTALILEDGGSVAWDVNRQNMPIDSALKEIRSHGNNERKADEYESEFDAFVQVYNKNGQKTDFTRRAFSFFSRATQNKNGKWVMFNPDLEALLCQATPEQVIDASYRSLSIKGRGMFGASTNLIHPKIIYRNLHVPMLILDPVSNEDWFDFEKENKALQEQHPGLIVHKVYPDTGHELKIQRPAEFTRDVIAFLSKALKRT